MLGVCVKTRLMWRVEDEDGGKEGWGRKGERVGRGGGSEGAPGIRLDPGEAAFRLGTD